MLKLARESFMTPPLPRGDRKSILLQRWITWLRLKKLRHELRTSEAFQKECEKLGCFVLADLEKRHRAEIEAKIQSHSWSVSSK